MDRNVGLLLSFTDEFFSEISSVEYFLSRTTLVVYVTKSIYAKLKPLLSTC